MNPRLGLAPRAELFAAEVFDGRLSRASSRPERQGPRLVTQQVTVVNIKLAGPPNDCWRLL